MSADPSAVSQNEGNTTPQSNWYESLAELMAAPGHSFTMGPIVPLPEGGFGVQMINQWGVMPPNPQG